jgi:hypothetical protein
MKRVQASTGTLSNMAAAHMIAPIRRILFKDVFPSLRSDDRAEYRLTIVPMPKLTWHSFASRNGPFESRPSRAPLFDVYGNANR